MRKFIFTILLVFILFPCHAKKLSYISKDKVLNIPWTLEEKDANAAIDNMVKYYGGNAAYNSTIQNQDITEIIYDYDVEFGFFKNVDFIVLCFDNKKLKTVEFKSKLEMGFTEWWFESLFKRFIEGFEYLCYMDRHELKIEFWHDKWKTRVIFQHTEQEDTIIIEKH